MTGPIEYDECGFVTHWPFFPPEARIFVTSQHKAVDAIQKLDGIDLVAETASPEVLARVSKQEIALRKMKRICELVLEAGDFSTPTLMAAHWQIISALDDGLS